MTTLFPGGDPSKWKWDDFGQLVQNATNMALAIAGGVAVIYIILGAYGYFTAFGSEEKAGKAKTTIMWAIIGLVVIILGRVLINEVWNFVTGKNAKF